MSEQIINVGDSAARDSNIKLWHFYAFCVVQLVAGITGMCSIVWWARGIQSSVDEMRAAQVSAATASKATQDQVTRMDSEGTKTWNNSKELQNRVLADLTVRVTDMQRELRQTSDAVVRLVAIGEQNQKLLKSP